MLIYYGMRRYGKANSTTRFGRCKACNYTGILESYTTANFLYVYWIPLIPVGHVKVLDECPNCGHHLSNSPLKHKKEKRADETSLAKRLREEPDNPRYVREALDHWSKHNDRANFGKMAEVYQSRASENPDITKTISRGYFRLGNFQKAIEIAERLPLDNPERSKLLEAAQAHLEAEKMGKRKKPKTRGIPILIPYLIPLFIILAILWNTFSGAVKDGKAREIWLVNGSLRSYTIQIDGTDYPINSQSTQTIELPMGKHKVQIKGTLLPVEPFAFEYDIPFAERVGDKKTLVLNPDGLAVLAITSIPYVADDTRIIDDPETTFEYKFGKNWYVLADVDWAFSPEEDRIDMPEGQNITYKKQLSLIKMTSYEECLDVLVAIDGADSIPALVEQALRIHPESDEAYYLLSVAQNYNKTAFNNELKIQLTQRPMLIEWHRYYQDKVQQTDPQHNLPEEYQLLLDADPNNPALLYLRGRIESDPEKAQDFFLAAEKGDNCRGYGYNALAYEKLTQLEFLEAFKYAQMSIHSTDSLPRFVALYELSCLATKNYQPLLKSIRDQKLMDPQNADLVETELRYLHLLEKENEAAMVSASFIAELLDNADREICKNYFDASQYYIMGHIDTYLEKLNASFPEQVKFQNALHLGNVNALLQQLKSAGATNTESYLIVYGASMHHKKEETAQEALQIAIDLLDLQPNLQDYLTGANNPTPQMLAKEKIPPASKLLFATTLGFLHPEQKNEYFELASTCNFAPYYPQLLVNSWINDQP